MVIWQTGSQLWQILLDNTTLSTAGGLVYRKLNDLMNKIIANCSAEDVKVIFESLLSEEVGYCYSKANYSDISGHQVSSHLLFVKQWQLILNSKMSTEIRKILNHYVSRVSHQYILKHCYKLLINMYSLLASVWKYW